MMWGRLASEEKREERNAGMSASATIFAGGVSMPRERNQSTASAPERSS